MKSLLVPLLLFAVPVFAKPMPFAKDFVHQVTQAKNMNELLRCETEAKNPACKFLSESQKKAKLPKIQFGLKRDEMTVGTVRLSMTDSAGVFLLDQREFETSPRWNFADLKKAVTEHLQRKTGWHSVLLPKAQANDEKLEEVLSALMAEANRIQSCEEAAQFANICVSRLDRVKPESVIRDIERFKRFDAALVSAKEKFEKIYSTYAGWRIRSCQRKVAQEMGECAVLLDKLQRAGSATDDTTRLYVWTVAVDKDRLDELMATWSKQPPAESARD